MLTSYLKKTKNSFQKRFVKGTKIFLKKKKTKKPSEEEKEKGKYGSE